MFAFQTCAMLSRKLLRWRSALRFLHEMERTGADKGEKNKAHKTKRGVVCSGLQQLYLAVVQVILYGAVITASQWPLALSLLREMPARRATCCEAIDFMIREVCNACSLLGQISHGKWIQQAMC